jgi:hypothetical protein
MAAGSINLIGQYGSPTGAADPSNNLRTLNTVLLYKAA